MIFDNIRSIRQYEGLGSNFQKAVQFLEALDLSRISQGDFEIDGRKVYAFANWITLKKPEEVMKPIGNMPISSLCFKTAK